jgi:probable rRNA maturation factor
MLSVDFVDNTDELADEEIGVLLDLLQKAGKEEGISEDAELSVSFVDNDEIQALNHQYRGINKPTDVISFALEDEHEAEIKIVGGDTPRMLGDIIISIPKTRAQAEEYGHSFIRELGFLTIHGFLHLLGYDHMTEEDEKVMFSRQKQILDAYGLTR